MCRKNPKNMLNVPVFDFPYKIENPRIFIQGFTISNQVGLPSGISPWPGVWV